MAKNNLVSFFKGSIILVISNMCLKAINFFLLPLYTNNLTPEMLGVSDTITTMVGFLLPLLTFGLDSAFSAFYFDENDLNRGKKVYSTLFFVFSFLGLIPFIGVALSNPISYLLFGTEQYNLIIKLAMVSISFNLWFLPMSLELRLQNKMAIFGLINVISSFLMIILNIIFVSILHMNEMSLILSTLIVHLVEIPLHLLLLRELPELSFFDTVLIKRMLVFALPIVPMTVMSWILSLSDRYILLQFCGETSVGLYGVGARFMTVLTMVISAVTTAYTTFAFSNKDDPNAKKQFYYVFNVMAIILIFISFSLSLFSKEVIKMMTSAEYINSYKALRDLLYSQILYGLSTIVGYGILFKQKSKLSFIAVFFAAIINLLLNIVFIPKFGFEAAALTTLLGYLTQFIITYIFSIKLYPCNYGLFRVSVVGFITYVISFMLEESNIYLKIFAFVATFVFGIICFWRILGKMRSFLTNIIKTSNISKYKKREN